MFTGKHLIAGSNMTATVFDERICTLGEGPLWHPLRQQLYWFDIIGQKLLTRSGQGASGSWSFEEKVSAAGWVDQETLFIAGETALSSLRLESGQCERVVDLEVANPVTRSNDGRADPWGGFWIGTMGKNAQIGAGAIYRYYRGELRQLFTPITIPNAICFSPDRRYGYFADTVKGYIWRQALEARDGWPQGDPELFIDCNKSGVHPDGAVVDSLGYLWNAQWGASRVACYDGQGSLVSTLELPASQISCPAFGGAGLETLYATSATEHLSAASLESQPDAGKTFAVVTGARGQREHQVVL